jgi:hypothetical protein
MTEEERAVRLDRLAALDSFVTEGVRRVLEDEEVRAPEVPEEELN